MFPAPSPNSQALFQALQSDTSTPGAVDFQRTAMEVGARNKNHLFDQPSNSQEDMKGSSTMDDKPQDQFASHDAEAANGLFMLAKGGQPGNRFPASNQRGQQQQLQPMQQQSASKLSSVKQEDKHKRNTASMGSVSGPEAAPQNLDSHEEASNKSNARGGRGKKMPKTTAAGSNRRKGDDNLLKPPAKRAKNGPTAMIVDPMLDQPEEDDDDDDSQDGEPTHDASGRKMTDEEKRKNFLERNRYVQRVSASDDNKVANNAIAGLRH